MGTTEGEIGGACNNGVGVVAAAARTVPFATASTDKLQTMTPADTPLQRGIALHRAGDLAGAAREYHAALAGDPHNADALHLLGLVAYRARDFAQARALVERALARDPHNPVFLSNLGNIRKDAGDADGAMDSYRR